MIKSRFLLFLFLIMIQGNGIAQVSLPAINLGYTSFADSLGFPGLFLQEYMDYNYSGSIKNGNGDSLAGNSSMRSWVLLNQLIYISKSKILGAHYGFDITVPVVDVSMKTRGKKYYDTGLGDITIGLPLLQWPKRKLFGMDFYQKLDFLIKIPSGHYDNNELVNTSKNLYSINPFYSFTLFMTPKIETSMRFSYLWNSKNHDPYKSLDVDDLQPGQAFHMNYAVSYGINKRYRIGVAGYFLQQLDHHEIDGHHIPNSKERVFAIGPGVMLLGKNMQNIVYLNIYFESFTLNRPEGSRVMLRFIKKI